MPSVKELTSLMDEMRRYGTRGWVDETKLADAVIKECRDKAANAIHMHLVGVFDTCREEYNYRGPREGCPYCGLKKSGGC